MFKFLKEKLKGWFKSSEKKAEEEKIEVKEISAKKIGKKSKKENKKKVEKKAKEKKVKFKEPEVKEEIIEEKVEEIKEEFQEEEPVEKLIEEKKGFFGRLFTRKFKITEDYFNEIFNNLELVLLENNVALDVVDYLKENLRKELVNIEVDKDKVDDTIKQALKISCESLFASKIDLLDKIKSKDGTFVIVFFGINGSGKTTTIAKLAYLLKKAGISSVLAAGDTFRAASIEQLVKHGEALGVHVIKQAYNADPAAVAFDAIEYAKAHKIKVVLVDTAGRMHTKDNLMKEMEKIIRVSKPDVKLFVAESTLGNDAIEQARTFNEAVGIDGIILSKADVDEKGGTSLSVSYITGKPILFLGVGQEYSDLEIFDKDKLIKELGL